MFINDVLSSSVLFAASPHRLFFFICKVDDREVMDWWCTMVKSGTHAKAFFASLIIRIFKFIFLIKIVFFSHNKLVGTVFQFVFFTEPTRPKTSFFFIFFLNATRPLF